MSVHILMDDEMSEAELRDTAAHQRELAAEARAAAEGD